LERHLFGWGGHNRDWPVDPETGKLLIGMVDALSLITFSSSGFFGIVTMVVGMLIGPWTVLRTTSKESVKREKVAVAMAVVLSLIVTLFMLDCLVNAMVNPTYIMITGALVGWCRGYKLTKVEGKAIFRESTKEAAGASCLY
jgi:hypothetical protein